MKKLNKLKLNGYKMMISQLLKKYLLSCESDDELNILGDALKTFSLYCSSQGFKNGITLEDFMYFRENNIDRFL